MDVTANETTDIYMCYNIWKQESDLRQHDGFRTDTNQALVHWEKKKAKVIVLADLISDKSHRSNMLLKLDYDNKFYFLLYLKGGFSHYYSHKGL